MEVMAVVRLAPGEVGYYDEITRIHLTLSNPTRTIYRGMNVTNIKRVVKTGRLILVSGSLEQESPKTQPVTMATKTAVVQQVPQQAPQAAEHAEQAPEVVAVKEDDATIVQPEAQQEQPIELVTDERPVAQEVELKQGDTETLPQEETQEAAQEDQQEEGKRKRRKKN